MQNLEIVRVLAVSAAVQTRNTVSAQSTYSISSNILCFTPKYWEQILRKVDVKTHATRKRAQTPWPCVKTHNLYIIVQILIGQKSKLDVLVQMGQKLKIKKGGLCESSLGTENIIKRSLSSTVQQYSCNWHVVFFTQSKTHCRVS